VRGCAIAPVLDFLRAAAIPAGSILTAAGLPSWISADDEVLIPARSVARVLGAAAQYAPIANLGLTLAHRAPIESFGILGRLIRTAPTLREALRRAVRYDSTFSSSGSMWLAQRGERVELYRMSSVLDDPHDVGCMEANLYCLGLMIGIVRLGAGPSWRPEDVHLQTDAAPGLRDAECLADCRVVPGRPATMLAIPRTLLAMRLSPPPPIEPAVDVVERWVSAAPAREFIGSIQQAVETVSRGGDPKIRQTADLLGLSVRTLQRRLAEAGIRHNTLVERGRFAMAAEVLADTNARIVDLASDLGYADHANFTRAFRRWAGCSPQEYRRRAWARRHGGPT
jgi:AraC-like DNA-binding protein